jgi:conjugative relaxase-like TrwC/TraI family protein
VISVKELHGADAWRYLMESVTDGQGDLRELDAVTRYFTAAGTPPGRWAGTGLAGLGRGTGLAGLGRGTGLAAGSLVSGEQMDLLFGQGRDPVTGDKLGRGYRHPPSYEQRVATRVCALPDHLTADERQATVERICEQERRRRMRRPVVGFDYVFSPPKSVSALWAVADQATRAQVTAAHHAAVRDILSLIERDVARTRIGTDGIAQVRVHGVVGASFDHYDSREHDPQLHTHVVVANRVQATDGRWRTLDSRGAIFPSVVALSETYDTLLADQLTRRLGVDWQVRDPGRKPKNAKWEIAGVPTALIEHFSTRRDQIEQAKERLVAAWRERTGRDPDDATVLRLRQRANRETRRAKSVYPLAVLVEYWQRRASTLLGGRDPAMLVRSVRAAGRSRRVMRADDFVGERLDALATEVLERLHESRSTWTRWNILAETARVMDATPDGHQRRPARRARTCGRRRARPVGADQRTAGCAHAGTVPSNGRQQPVPSRVRRRLDLTYVARRRSPPARRLPDDDRPTRAARHRPAGIHP